MDEAFRMICSLISPDLLFHISSCKTPNQSWTTLYGIFGKHDEMRGTHVGGGISHIGSKNLRQYPIFFTKFKYLLLQLKACRADKSKEEKEMVLTILSKLGPKLFVFV
jgi:hypothetical protein